MCIEKYLEFSESVFQLDKNIIKLPTGQDYCRFSEKPLEAALKKVIFDTMESEDTPLGDTTDQSCPVLVVATFGQVADGPLKLFKSYGFYKDQCPIWQAARATSAAPAFFPAAWVDVPSPGGWYIDGGVRANNPSYEAMLEGKKHWKTRKCFMVSIGTGFQKPADFIGDKQAPGAMKTGGSAIESKSPESDAAQNVEVDQSIFGGVKSGLMKASATIGGMVKAATGRVQSVTDKAGQMTRIPGGIKTVARILETLATLSTNSEHTHRRVWEEAHSEDESLQFPYFRFNVPRGMEKIGLEEWKATEKITALTRSYLESPDIKKELENCAEGLWNPSAIEST